MVKAQVKYLLTICIFLICGYSSAFSKTHSRYKQTITGHYAFVDTLSDSDFAAYPLSASDVSLDQQKKHASLENKVFEIEEYEEIIDLKKSPENHKLFSNVVFHFLGETVFHYSENRNFLHKDKLYPTLDIYILLQVFRI